jgi:general secretion pathway protein N
MSRSLQMSRSLAIVSIGFALSLHTAAATSPTITTDALDAGIAEETRLGGPVTSSSSEPVTSVRVVAPPPAPEQPLSANPLWAIPLTKLSGTRDRPIFSPSRRPPPPVVAAEPSPAPPPSPRKKELEPPPLSLVGTIASDEESFGIFLDPSTKQALRLKLGEDYQGWKLRTVQGREVTVEKDQQSTVLTLPAPSAQGNNQVLLTPVNADGSSPQAAMRRR